MLLKKLPFLFIPILFTVVLNINFLSHKQKNSYEDIPSFQQIINKNINVFKNEINVLNSEALAFQNNTQNLSELKSQLLKTRKAYKTVEYILEYFYPEHIKAYINGAPLVHVDPNPTKEKYNLKSYYTATPKEYSKNMPLDYRDKNHFRGEAKELLPVGLQVLDELIFSDTVTNEKQTVLNLTQQLETNFFAVENALKNRQYIVDFEIIEASRLELIRIFTLGITGFDTPGSLNAIEEASTSLKAIQEVLNPLLLKSTPSHRKNVDVLFKEAILYLKKNTDFNTLDRLTFLTQSINPLYKTLLDVQKDLNIPSSAEKYNNLASWNSNSTNIFSEDILNPYYYSLLTEDADNSNLRALGKQLFYDQNISQSGNMSCVSCHKPELAFTDGRAKSIANMDGKTVLRNSPTLINAVFSDRYFYDLRAYDLEEQAEHVIANHLEFNTNFPEIIKKINADEAYLNLFKKAFNNEDGEITRYQFSSALSSYVLSLQSFNSSFDQYVLGKTDKISNKVKRGFNLFTGKANCATCHYPPTFSGLVPPLYRENESEVLGVLKSPNGLEVDTDLGRMNNNISLDNYNIYKNSFKTTTVRNAKLTAPYFHNGAYNTLEQVIDFYNEGGAVGVGLSYDVPNQTLSPSKLDLSKREIKDLIAFIESLTDNPF